MPPTEGLPMLLLHLSLWLPLCRSTHHLRLGVHATENQLPNAQGTPRSTLQRTSVSSASSASSTSRAPVRWRSPLGTNAQPAAGQAALEYIAFRRDAAAGAAGCSSKNSCSDGTRTSVPPVPVLVRAPCLRFAFPYAPGS
jgi:hypothetical protein